MIGNGGSPFISDNDFVLISVGLPEHQLGLFYYGPNQVDVPFGSGFRCVGGQIQRLPVVNTGDLGVAVYYLDLERQDPGPNQISEGSTWNFQYWYRDPLDGGAGYNLSDGLEVTFCP